MGTFQGRTASMPAPNKKGKRASKFEGMTKEEVRQLKKEQKQRRLWNKYKAKLQKEREEVSKQFRNSYYWNCFQPTKVSNPDNSGVKDAGTITSNFTTNPSGQKAKLTSEGALASARQSLAHGRNNLVHLQQVISDSCSYYEKMEHREEGSLERMLQGLRNKIEVNKVRVQKREQYDHLR